MKRVIYFTLLICVATAVIVNGVEAQSKKTGTAAATELLIPIGARDLAMGGSTTANTYGVEAIHYNPAGLGRIKFAAEGMFSKMNYIADIGVNYGAVGGSLGAFGVVALSVKSLSFGDIPLTTEDDPENTSGRFFSPSFVTVGFSYARALTDAISVGGTVKLVSEKIERVSSSGFALDFGVLYNGLVGIQGLNLGVAVKNVGPQMKFEGTGLFRNAISGDGRRPEQFYKSDAASFELPSVVEIGLTYDRKFGENMMWSLNGSFTNNNLYRDEFRVGGEVGYTMESVSLFGRAGIGMVAQADERADIFGNNVSESIFGATFGAGISYAA
ncbi:MAG: PorV/PorQ family protein, partial [Bacteroidota bacterium]